MRNVKIRYIVDDVDAAIGFYCQSLGFKLDMHPAPGFAALSKGALQLYLNAPGAGGAGATMPDGTEPEPGGWNRIQIEVEDLEKTIADLRNRGASFRNEVVDGKGGKQILLQDPAGNLIELFEPHENGDEAREMRLTGVELYSKDLGRSRAFYSETLGLTLAEDDPAHHIMFDSGDIFLCLEVPGAENYPSRDKAVLFFQVSDLAAVADRIGRDQFVKLELEIANPWAVLHDPDGHNVLLLHERRQ